EAPVSTPWKVPFRSAVDDPSRCLACRLLLEQVGDQERQLDRLIGIEARVAMGVVAVLQLLVADGARAAGAFGDVLARHLDVNAARMRSFGAVHLEEALHLLEDAVERARLVAGGGDGVAVHRIAGPDDLAAFLLN